jgi:hypothetical protein
MKCKNCNEKDAIKYSKYSNGLFCSKECARAYSTKLKRKEINEKIRQSLTGTGNDDVEIICKKCNKIFIVKWSRRKQNFCSKECGSQYSNNQPEKLEKLSKSRVNAIKNGIVNGNGKKSKYIFKNIEIDCDSKIENSCINYFEKLGATDISRSKLVLTYKDHNNKKRRFLPDFEITLNNKKYLVEAKGYISLKTLDDKWREYNKISEIKKKVLEKYCKENDLIPFWFTQNLNRKYYKKI